MRCLAYALCATIASAALPAAASEYTRYDRLDLPGGGSVLLNTPAAWRSGDPTVVLVFDPAEPPGQRDTLVGALLAAQEAVVEVPVAALPAAMRLMAAEGAAGPVLMLTLSGGTVTPRGLSAANTPAVARPFCEAVAWGLSAGPTPPSAPRAAFATEEGCRAALMAGR